FRLPYALHVSRHWNCTIDIIKDASRFQREAFMKTGPVRRRKITARTQRRRAISNPFDTTIQKTQVWLNELMSDLDWQERPHKAYLALRTVLHALRDRLTVEEAIQFGAQLPMLIRGFYYEGWTLKGKPRKERHKRDFLDHIAKAFKKDVTVDPHQVCRAVFRVLVRHTSKGEIGDVKHQLPKEFQELWP
ncbi:MAG TPA: DUF2267 domain-containing protein, partial [Candidatus Acidoferrales bacterium]|nr:DUF2267 domain-containing protein [Candidatus Acidoferrales bacterium]